VPTVTDDVEPAPVLAFPPTPIADVQGTLALDLMPRRELPEPHASGAPGADVVPIDLRRREQMEGWTARFAQAAVEIVGGDRPATQLLRWTSPQVYEELEQRAEYVARAGGHANAVGRVQPVRPKIATVHTCFVEEGLVEAAVRIRYGARSRALAARFERVDDATGSRWVCTALQWS
jgi:hypothetical protein